MQINSNFSGNVKWPKNKNNGDVVDAIPTNISDLFKDDDKNSIPDFSDKMVKQGKNKHRSKNFNKTYININGKTFNNIEDAMGYVIESISALRFVNKIFSNKFFFNSKLGDIIIDGEIVNSEKASSSFGMSQRINPNSQNLTNITSKIDLILGLITLALVFVVILYFIFQ